MLVNPPTHLNGTKCLWMASIKHESAVICSSSSTLRTPTSKEVQSRFQSCLCCAFFQENQSTIIPFFTPLNEQAGGKQFEKIALRQTMMRMLFAQEEIKQSEIALVHLFPGALMSEHTKLQSISWDPEDLVELSTLNEACVQPEKQQWNALPANGDAPNLEILKGLDGLPEDQAQPVLRVCMHASGTHTADFRMFLRAKAAQKGSLIVAQCKSTGTAEKSIRYIGEEANDFFSRKEELQKLYPGWNVTLVFISNKKLPFNRAGESVPDGCVLYHAQNFGGFVPLLAHRFSDPPAVTADDSEQTAVVAAAPPMAAAPATQHPPLQCACSAPQIQVRRRQRLPDVRSPATPRSPASRTASSAAPPSRALLLLSRPRDLIQQSQTPRARNSAPVADAVYTSIPCVASGATLARRSAHTQSRCAAPDAHASRTGALRHSCGISATGPAGVTTIPVSPSAATVAPASAIRCCSPTTSTRCRPSIRARCPPSTPCIGSAADASAVLPTPPSPASSTGAANTRVELRSASRRYATTRRPPRSTSSYGTFATPHPVQSTASSAPSAATTLSGTSLTAGLLRTRTSRRPACPDSAGNSTAPVSRLSDRSSSASCLVCSTSASGPTSASLSPRPVSASAVTCVLPRSAAATDSTSAARSAGSPVDVGDSASRVNEGTLRCT
eukprot:TRINITY_DN351_c0_g1_i3.p1 TRINITY_DN351_c0_g1~~TRINITY_DN351_c0_g1_i3.p1  ORF type:complete len:671 (+),score=97.52 TRINITY_DN351_c0_g1_i3:1590-3602(+)